MATTAAKAAGGSKKNDGATVLWAGNLPANSRVTNGPGLNVMIRSGVGENVAAGPDPSGQVKFETAKPVSAGAFNAQRSGQYIIPRVTTLIAGVANTTLLTGAADFGRKPIASIKDILHSYLYSFSFTARTNSGSGIPTEPFAGVTVTPSYSNTAYDTLGTDAAANPTRAIPGQLVYLETGKTPTTSNYKPRND